MHKSKIKIWEASLLIALCICLCQAAAESGAQQALSEKILRMHVVASSDAPEAQALKLRVRDAAGVVLEELLADCSSLEEAQQKIEEGRELILAAAREAADGERVEMRLAKEPFSYREAEGYALPAGEYSALRLIIGDGEGRNWWGVIFPALDLSGGYAQAAEYLSEYELALICDEDGVELRFRFLELWERLMVALGK